LNIRVRIVEEIVKLLVAAAAAAIAWRICQPQYVFLVRIENGEPRAARGKVAAAFLDEIRDVCGRHQVRRGWLGAVAKGRRTGLNFSNSIPPHCRQQLRNMWLIRR
jgi:hypothetical protein